jgi:hypothetical protein
MWKRESLFSNKSPLPDDMVYYSAWDVEPLLDIQQIMASIMEPDFVPMFNVNLFR